MSTGQVMVMRDSGSMVLVNKLLPMLRAGVHKVTWHLLP